MQEKLTQPWGVLLPALLLVTITGGYALTVHADRTESGCEQLFPNPNPAFTQHNIDSKDGCNELEDYENFGTLINSGDLDNNGSIRNLGKLLNLGKFNNFGEITNVQSRSGNIRNDGTLNNFGNVTGFGATDNNGILNNYGRFNTGDFGKNNGVINNYADATLFSAQRYTNNGVVNNSEHATIRTKIGWINSSQINNSGKMNFSRARFLINKGTLNIAEKAELSSHYEITNAGLIQLDGTITGEGTISNTGLFTVSESGKVEGAGAYVQSSGGTDIHGSIEQELVTVSGGTVSGTGSFIATVAHEGGLFEPGNVEFGALSVVGDYRQSSRADVAIDLGGLEPGTEHDVLYVSGTAHLGGELRVRLYEYGGGPYVPKEGDRFDVLRAGSIVGEFSRLRFARLPETLQWEVVVLSDSQGRTDTLRLIVKARSPR